MTIDRHHYKYVHIHSSNHKSGNNFRIKVPHGLNACSRVALQNFSIPNTIGNSYGPLSKLYWVEFMKDNATSGVGDWSKKIFYIDLSDIPSYTQNSQIADLIHAKFQNEVYDYDTGTIGTHQFTSEDPLEINFAYDENHYIFQYSISQTTLTQDVGVKVFVPAIFENDVGLWEHFGFVNETGMIGINSRSYFSTPDQSLEALNRDFKTIYPQSTDIPAGVDGVPTYKTLNGSGKLVREDICVSREFQMPRIIWMREAWLPTDKPSMRTTFLNSSSVQTLWEPTPCCVKTTSPFLQIFLDV